MTESWFHSYICGKAGRVLSGDLTNRSESELEKFTNFVSEIGPSRKSESFVISRQCQP